MAWIMRRTALRRRPTPRGCWTGSRRLGSFFFGGVGKTMDFMVIHGDLTNKMGICIGIILGNFRGCHGKWRVHPCVDDKSILDFLKLVLRVYLKSEGKNMATWGSFTFSLFQEWRWFSGNNRDGTLGNCSGIKFITTLVHHKRSIRSMICMSAFVTRVGKMRFFFYLLGIIGRPFRTGGEDFPGALAGWIWGPLVCTMNFQQIALGPREFSLLKILQVRKRVGYLLNYISHARVCGSTKPFFWCTAHMVHWAIK